MEYIENPTLDPHFSLLILVFSGRKAAAEGGLEAIHRCFTQGSGMIAAVFLPPPAGGSSDSSQVLVPGMRRPATVAVDPDLGVLSGWNKKRGNAAGPECVIHRPVIIRSVTEEGGNVFSYTIKNVVEDGGVVRIVVGGLDAHYLPVRVNPDMDLLPPAVFAPAVLSGFPLSLAGYFGPGAVQDQMDAVFSIPYPQRILHITGAPGERGVVRNSEGNASGVKNRPGQSFGLSPGLAVDRFKRSYYPDRLVRVCFPAFLNIPPFLNIVRYPDSDRAALFECLVVFTPVVNLVFFL